MSESGFGCEGGRGRVHQGHGSARDELFGYGWLGWSKAMQPNFGEHTGVEYVSSTSEEGPVL